MRRERCCFFFFFSEDGISLLKHVLLIENCCVISSNNQFSALASVCFFCLCFCFCFFCFLVNLTFSQLRPLAHASIEINSIKVGPNCNLIPHQFDIWPLRYRQESERIGNSIKTAQKCKQFFFFFLELFSISFRSKTSCQNHQRIQLNPYDNNLSKCIRYYQNNCLILSSLLNLIS